MDTCNNYDWDSLEGIIYDFEGWDSEETYKEFEQLLPYLSDFDVIGREKIYQKKEDCKKPADHILALRLQDEVWFCPECNKEKLEANQVSKYPEKFKFIFIKNPSKKIE